MPPGDDAGGEDEFAGLPEVGVLLCQHTSSCTSLLRLHAAEQQHSGGRLAATAASTHNDVVPVQHGGWMDVVDFTHHVSSFATHRVVCLIHQLWAAGVAHHKAGVPSAGAGMHQHTPLGAAGSCTSTTPSGTAPSVVAGHAHCTCTLHQQRDAAAVA